ncbi:helix-turn-helix domain-containing protein [Desulfolucanica intricata]|uniref:helix-turn-helix domain-containing protein n=1 Tax=Desulfolucanica intricata TaxID=1285191 RepID=UPI000830696F|nr:helix-turn-helix transcriptional regulator [Desulfolucanica intricata]
MYEPKELGLKVKEARRILSKKIGEEFTPKKLAVKIGETSKWVQKLESGQFYPDWDALNFIAEVCGVDLEFLTGENFKNKTEYKDAIEGGDVARKIDLDEINAQ